MIRIGVIGDFRPGYLKHEATTEALVQAAAAIGVPVEVDWLGTAALARAGGDRLLSGWAGLVAAPNSPYEQLEGGLAAIRFARESGTPFLATCGGFQHTLLEYARHVAGLTHTSWGDYGRIGGEPLLVLSTCTPNGGAYRLAGRRRVMLDTKSRAGRIYGRPTIDEEFLCNYVLSPRLAGRLAEAGLHVAGTSAEREVWLIELPEHPFFIGTAFLPQWSSTSAAPHPLFTAFLQAAGRYQRNGACPNPD